MKEKERLERALRIALDRAYQEVAREPGLALDVAVADRCARVESWRDVERLINRLEDMEREMGVVHVSISGKARILASEDKPELMEEDDPDFSQDQVVRQELRRLGLPVNLIGPRLGRIVRHLPLGAIVETADTKDWWILSRWGATWTSTPIHRMAFVRAGYPPRIAELLYKGEAVSDDAVRAERLLMRLEKLGYEVHCWLEPQEPRQADEWVAMALVDGVDVGQAWGKNREEAILALARELGHAEAAD